MSHYKPYPVYKDSGNQWINEVPEHWKVKRLRHVATFNNSNVDKKSYEDQNEVMLCNYTDVYYNEFITSNLEFMNATASDAEIEKFKLKQGDVIITKDSEDPRDIGIPALVKEDLNHVICGYHLTVIKAHDPSLSGFIHRSIQSQSTKAHFFVESPGITRYGLDQDAIGDIPICVPPLEEREDLINAINQETSRIDTLIARKSRFTQLLTEKILAIVTHSFEYEDTRWVRLQHVCNVISRPVNQKNGESYTRLGLYNRGRGAFKKAVADNEDMGDSDFFWVEEGDLILSGQFAWEGAVAIATNQHDKCVVSHRFPIIHGRKGEALTEYLFAFFMTHYGDFILNDCSRGSAGRNRPLNINALLLWKIPIPSFEVQTKIASLINLREKIQRQTQHSIDLLKERRTAFITAAVTGKIDVRNKQESIS